MRIVMIGLGDIATKAYLPVAATHADVTPLLCTRNPETLARLGHQYRIDDCFADLDSLLAAKPDAAMIHTATDSHASIAKRLLQEGIPVFVDKPISYQLNEVEEVIELATRKNVSLTVGFNRRFSPLIRPIGQCENLVQAHLQKNRTRWPAEPRVYIYDDFIHVIDTLRYLAPANSDDLQVFAYGKSGELSAIQVQWRAGRSLLTGSMNRVSGITEERLEVFAEDKKWQIDNLRNGTEYSHNPVQPPRPLVFGDWENTLRKRGFVDMFGAWLEQLKVGKQSNLADIWATHQLCEAVVQKVESQLQAK